MKVTIDRSGCISCGVCEEECPEVFRMDDGGIAEAYGEVTEANKAAVQKAAEECPTEVIKIEE